MNKTSKKKPLICTVNRKTWARGNKVPDDNQSLLNQNGTRCCLGFLAKKCDVPDTSIEEVGMPYDLDSDEYMMFPHVEDAHYSIWNKFANINDDKVLSEEEREEKLRQLAKENGFRFRFVGE
jgi:hypothetical protein